MSSETLDFETKQSHSSHLICWTFLKQKGKIRSFYLSLPVTIHFMSTLVFLCCGALVVAFLFSCCAHFFTGCRFLSLVSLFQNNCRLTKTSEFHTALNFIYGIKIYSSSKKILKINVHWETQLPCDPSHINSCADILCPFTLLCFFKWFATTLSAWPLCWCSNPQLPVWVWGLSRSVGTHWVLVIMMRWYLTTNTTHLSLEQILQLCERSSSLCVNLLYISCFGSERFPKTTSLRLQVIARCGAAKCGLAGPDGGLINWFHFPWAFGVIINALSFTIESNKTNKL